MTELYFDPEELDQAALDIFITKGTEILASFFEEEIDLKEMASQLSALRRIAIDLAPDELAKDVAEGRADMAASIYGDSGFVFDS